MSQTPLILIQVLFGQQHIMIKKASHVIQHLLKCISIMGKPKEIKTDNGPSKFFLQWDIKHSAGIPYIPPAKK
jgi:hypothetical protein